MIDLNDSSIRVSSYPRIQNTILLLGKLKSRGLIHYEAHSLSDELQKVGANF